MAIDIEQETGAGLPYSGPAGLPGSAHTVTVPATSTTLQLINRSVYLLGWSFRETTGTAPAVAELFDGTSTGGEYLGAVTLTGGNFSGINQTPVAAAASGANAQQAPSIGGGAGTLAFVQSITITGLGATAAGQVTAVLSGLLGASINYPITVPAGVTVPITNVFDSFGTIGIQASAAATAIVLTLPAFGAGNTLEQAALNGYTQASPAPASTSGGASASQSFGYPGLLLRSGLFLNVVSGTLKGAIWVRQ